MEGNTCPRQKIFFIKGNIGHTVKPATINSLENNPEEFPEIEVDKHSHLTILGIQGPGRHIRYHLLVLLRKIFFTHPERLIKGCPSISREHSMLYDRSICPSSMCLAKCIPNRCALALVSTTTYA